MPRLVAALLLLALLSSCASSRYVLVEGRSDELLHGLKHRHIGSTITVEYQDGRLRTARLADFDAGAVYLGGEHSQPVTRIPVAEISNIQLEKINEGAFPVMTVVAITTVVVILSAYTAGSF